jgi:hypothetical protein
MKNRRLFTELGGGSYPPVVRTTSRLQGAGAGILLALGILLLLSLARQMDERADAGEADLAAASAQGAKIARDELLPTINAAYAEGRRAAIRELCAGAAALPACLDAGRR